MEAYLGELCREGHLNCAGGGIYEISDDTAEHVEAERARLRAIDARKETVDSLLDDIITNLPPAEIYDFDVARWRILPLPGEGVSVDQLIAAGGAAYGALLTHLRSITAMVAGGDEIVDVLLDLPVAAERQRAGERRSKRLGAEADVRRANLRAAAMKIPDFEAEGWLAREHTELGDIPSVLAGRSEAGLQACLKALDAIASRLDQDRAAALATGNRRKQLTGLAERLYPAELRSIILSNYAPDLNGSPWDACVSDAGLSTALAYLHRYAPARARRRR